jgi:hypothetical protein
MNFSFDITAKASQNLTQQRLPGNTVHKVTFVKCEAVDIPGVKHPGEVYKVLRFRFENENGYFEHTVFEPKEGDDQRKSITVHDKNGNINEIEQPSNIENIMLLFKHIIDAINPEVAAKIDAGTASLKASNWDELRNIMCKILNPKAGTETNIKLLKNNNGDAVFPSYFTRVVKTEKYPNGLAVIRNNFIGDKIAFTTYEMDRIQKQITKEKDTVPSTVFEETQTDDAPEYLSFDVDTL